MKVLVSSIYYPPRLGGIENHVYYLCRGLARRGHEVTVLTSRTESESAAHEIDDGVEVFRLPMPSKSPLGWAFNALAQLPKGIQLGAECDVMHAHTFASALPFLPMRRLRSRPLVVTIHSSHFLKMAEKRRWRPILRGLLSSADLLLAPSVELADTCRRVVPGCDAREIVNGIDTNLFQAVAPSLQRKGDKKIVLATRRLVEKNGVRYLVEAMPLIQARVPCELYLAGDGPEEADLRARVRRLGIEDSVHFLGGVPNTEVPQLLSSADAVVLPSLMEATSLSALEAMACERPMAVSRVGGLPELVDAGCGTLFNPADPSDLAEKLSALLLLSDSARALLGEEARRRVTTSWSVEALVDKHIAFFEEVIVRRSK